MNQVAAFRLARHHLAGRAPAESLAAVVRDMGGAQAQLASAAQMSLWARTRDLKLADVDEALDKRTLVKAACMRRTLFLVPSKELAMFVRGSARRAEKEIRWARGKGVPDRVLDAAIEAALEILDQPLTRTEIAGRVSRRLGVQMQPIHGGGWGSRKKIAGVPVGSLTYPVVDLLHLVGARGVVCYGPYQGNEPTFVRADAWIPKWRDVPREKAEGLLLRRYLGAFGPATVEDFAMWAGITLTDAREIWSREQAGIAPVDVAGRAAALLRKDLHELEEARLDHPHVNLLPHFDTFLLGHRERRHLVTAEHHADIYRAQGWIAPVVLVDGRSIGIWEHTREGNRLRVQVRKFEPISRGVLASIRQEAQDLSRFLEASNVEIRVG